jgi:hypothetical protein
MVVFIFVKYGHALAFEVDDLKRQGILSFGLLSED